jgi:hypothetical protein
MKLSRVRLLILSFLSLLVLFSVIGLPLQNKTAWR